MAEAKIEIILSNGAKAGSTLQELTKEANKLNKEVSKLAPGSEEFVKKTAEFQSVSGRIKDVKGQITGTTQASDQLKKSFTQWLPFGSQIQGVTGQLAGMRAGVGGLSTQFGVLRTAIISTGLGIFIVLLGGLVNWLSKVEAVTNILKGAFDGLMGAVNVLMKAIATMSFDNLGDDMAKAAKEGYELVQVFDQLEDKQRALSLQTEKSGLIVDQLLLQSKNVQASFAERIDLLDQASKVETENHKARLKYAEEYAAAVDREVANAERQGVMNDELADKQIEAQKALISVNRESIVLQEKIANRRSALEEKQAAEEEKKAQAAAKRREEERKAFEAQMKAEASAAQTIEDIKVALMKEGVDKQIAQIELDTQRKQQALQGSDQQIIEAALLLEQDKINRIQAVRDKAKAEQDIKDEAKRKEDEKKKLDALTLELATEQNLINESLLNGQITEQEFTELTAQQAIDFQTRKLELLKAAHGEQSIEYQRAYAEYLKLQQGQADAAVAIKKKEMEDQMAALQGALGTFGNFFGTLASFQKQGTDQWKAFAVAQAIMSTIQSSINAYQSTAAIPIVGPALAPIAAGLALAAGYQNVRKIQNTKAEPPTKPKASRGFVLRGPSHAAGGIPIEAEGEEIILTKGVYRNPFLRRQASLINVAAGGVSFDNTSPIGSLSKFESGGVPSSPSTPGQALGIDYGKLAVFMDQAMEKKILTLKVQQVLTETRDGLKTIQEIEEKRNV